MSPLWRLPTPGSGSSGVLLWGLGLWRQIEQSAVPIPLKKAVQTLHQAIICGLVGSCFIFHLISEYIKCPDACFPALWGRRWAG